MVDHVQRGDDLVMLLLGDVRTHKDAQVAHAFVQHVDDDTPRRGNGAFAAPGVDDPVQRLRRRRDVVAPGGKHHHRCADVAQIDVLVAQHHLAAGQFVADEQVLDDGFDLRTRHAEVAAPPALELQKTLGFGIDLRPQPVVAAPQRVGRVELFKVFDQVRAIKAPAGQIGRHARQPGATQRGPAVAHRVELGAAGPVRKRRTHHHQRAEEFRPHRRQHGDGPTRLAVADDHRLRRLGVARDDLFQEACFGMHHIGQGLAFFGLRAECHAVHRVPGTQRHAHFGILLEATDARPVACPRVHHHQRACARQGRHIGRGQHVHQRVIAGPRQIAPVQHHFVVKLEQRRLAGAHMFGVAVAPFAQRVHEEHAALEGVHRVGHPGPDGPGVLDLAGGGQYKSVQIHGDGGLRVIQVQSAEDHCT